MEDIVANSELRSRICEDILSGSFLHAYIIEGLDGSGKHTIAKYIAAALACERKGDAEAPLPCKTCASCKKILSDLSPDVITVGSDGKASLGVDKIRFLKEDVHIIPNELDDKVYIIEDADKMTTQAQNALLLTLEEPPAYARFLLLCENSELLLETIKSRAPILRTEPIPTDMIDAYISKHDVRAAQMKASSPEDFAELLMAASFGIGNALELLDTKKLAPVLENRRLVKDFLDCALGVERNPQSITLLRRFAQKRDALASQIDLLRLAIRDLIVSKKSDSVTLCFFASREHARELCDATSIAHLFKISNAADAAADRISKNANVRLTLVSLLSDTDMI